MRKQNRKQAARITLILLLLLFSVFPVNAFVVGPGVVYIVLNGADPDEFYEMDRNLEFNNITLEQHNISFNGLIFNLTADDQVFVNMSWINNDTRTPTDTDRLVSFNISASPGTVCLINLSNLLGAHEFRLYNKTGGVNHSKGSCSSGSIEWNVSGGQFTATHTWSFHLYDNETFAIVYTNATTGVNLTNATLHGYVLDEGETETDNYGFQYGETSSTTSTVEFDGGFENDPYDGKGTSYVLASLEGVGEGFKVGFNGTNCSYTISGINLYLKRISTPGTVTVRLYLANASWGPTGAVLASGTIDGNLLSTSFREETINFTTPLLVHPAERYAWTICGACPGVSTLHVAYHWFDSDYLSYIYKSSDNCTTYHIYSSWGSESLAFELLGNITEFKHDLTGLTKATRYFHRAYVNNSYGRARGDVVQFLTEPDAPSVFTATSAFGSIDLEWENPAIGSGVNRSIYIVYNNASYPTSRGDGTLLLNTSSLADTDSYSVSFVGTVYFSIWSYINCSTLHRFSPTYLTASASSGGNFNITVYYENWTQGFVNLSKFGPHKITVYGANSTREMNLQGYNTWGDLRLNLSCGSVRHQLTSGYLAFNLSFNPYQIELRWNNSEGLSKRCYRMITCSGEGNYTFYIITNRSVYDGLYVTEFNNTLVKWTYNFIDNTGVFLNRPGLDTYAYVYTYSPNGTRMIIHSEYLDSYDKIYPMLLYGKKYYIGVSCSVSTIDNLGFAPTETDASRTTSVYVTIMTESAVFLPQYTIKVGWMTTPTGLYVYYTDALVSVTSSWVRVWDYVNRSLMYTSTSIASTKNYTYTTADHDRSYEISLLINSSHRGLNVLYHIYLIPGVEPRWSYDIINDTLTYIFGYTPFRSYEEPSGLSVVPWADVLVFVIFLFLLFSISGYNAALAGLVSGGWFIFAGTMISGSPVTFVVIGVVILFISFLYAWSDRR